MSRAPNLVSVIMPARNGRRYLPQAIESLFAQTYADWELVFVDDGSTDDTAAVARSYSDRRVRYFRQSNAGQAAALNRGLELAQGELVTTLDVDDWLTTDSLAARVERLHAEPSLAAVYGDGVFCDSSGEEIQRFRDLIPHPPEGDVYPALISNPFIGTGANVLVRRDFLDRHALRYDESLVWCQDFDFCIRIAEIGRFGRIAASTVWYRQHEANMTAAMPRQRRMESMFRAKRKAMESGRFSSLDLESHLKFFYELLRNDLYGLTRLQSRILGSSQFLALPKQEQARLLRLIAVSYLAGGEELGFAADCIEEARKTFSRDAKSQALALLLKLDSGLARRAVQRWSASTAGRA